MFEKYYSSEQLESLEKRRQEVGAEEIAAVESAWVSLADRVRAAMESGLLPSSPEVSDLVRDWRALTKKTVQGFSGGDLSLGQSAGRLLQSEPQVSRRWGMNQEMGDWIGSALEYHHDV